MPRGKKCPECGKPYIHFDLHWNICPKNTEVADNDVAQDGSANAKVHSELAQEAQSEAPSVVDELIESCIAVDLRHIVKGEATMYLEPLKAKINRLIVDELEKLIDVPMNQRIGIIRARIEELKNGQ